MKSLSKAYNGNRPLLIQPAVAKEFLANCSQISIPAGAKLSDMGEMLETMFGKRPTLEVFPPFAVVPVKGVIGRGLSELESYCGAVDLKDVEEMLESVERDPRVKTIIFAIDSPGGTSVGVPELANRIRSSKKQTIAFTDSEACSAAYWLASQCEQVIATPSASVGSIGCYIAYLDESKAYADEGLTVDVIKSGKFKGAGIPGTSLDADQKSMLLEEVVEIHEEFKAAVKAVRTFASDEAMEAKIYSGKKAAENGLVTGIVNGFDELMESLDKAVAEQMEADEGNDEKAEEAEGDEGEDYARMTAAQRAIGKTLLSSLSKQSLKVTIETEEGDDEDEKTEDEEDDEKKMTEDESEKDKSDEVTPEPKEDDEEEPSKEEKAEDGDSAEDEKKDGEPPQADMSDEEPDDEKAKKQADDSEDAVDTDEKHDRKDSKRHRAGSKIS